MFFPQCTDCHRLRVEYVCVCVWEREREREIPLIGGSEEGQTRDTASHRKVSPAHYRLSYSGPYHLSNICSCWMYKFTAMESVPVHLLSTTVGVTPSFCHSLSFLSSAIHDSWTCIFTASYSARVMISISFWVKLSHAYLSQLIQTKAVYTCLCLLDEQNVDSVNIVPVT